MDYKDRAPILALFGVILLLAGVAMALLGPAEIYTFYLFSAGGRFHYEGFGVGSFMFANIAAQIVGYYLIAVVAIPLGYGHLKRLRWARTLALVLLGFWLVAGIPLIVVFLFVLASSKGLSFVSGVITLALLALAYAVVPGLLIRFYSSRDVRLTFEARDPRAPWVEEVPLPVLVTCSIFALTVAVLHVLILFHGIFPLLHTLVYGWQGVILIDVSVLLLLVLVWGLLRLRAWAWWGALLYWGLLTFSSLAALSRSSLADILSRMRFAPLEMEILGGVPLHGSHLAVLVGIPLLVTLGLIAYARRFFSPDRERVSESP